MAFTKEARVVQATNGFAVHCNQPQKGNHYQPDTVKVAMSLEEVKTILDKYFGKKKGNSKGNPGKHKYPKK